MKQYIAIGSIVFFCFQLLFPCFAMEEEKQVLPLQVPVSDNAKVKYYEFYLTPAGKVYYTEQRPVVTVKTKDNYEYLISLEKLKGLAPYFYNMYNDFAEFEPDDADKLVIPVCKDTFLLLTFISFVVKEFNIEVDQLNVWNDFGETFKTRNVLRELDKVEADIAGEYIKKCFGQLFPGEFDAKCKILKSQNARDIDKLEAFKALYLALANLPKEKERKEFLNSLERRKIDTHFFKLPSSEKLAVINLRNDLAPLLVPILWKRFLNPTHITITIQVSELDPEFTNAVFPAGNNYYYTSAGNNKYSLTNSNNAYTALNERNQFFVIKVLGVLNLLADMDLKPNVAGGYYFTISGLLDGRYL